MRRERRKAWENVHGSKRQQGAYNRFEDGGRKKTVHVENAQKIADYFSVTLGELDSGDLSESDAEKAPAFNDESKRPYVDMDTARIAFNKAVRFVGRQLKR